MGIYAAQLVGRAAESSDVRVLTVAELGTRYNEALEDENGTAFAAGFTAAYVAAQLAVVTTTVVDDDLIMPPGNAVTLKNTGSDAEACTLADGSEIGQVTTIQMVEDSNGDATVTPATSTTVATIVFADVGDTATLQWRDTTIGWVIIGCFGLTAQPTITVPAP